MKIFFILVGILALLGACSNHGGRPPALKLTPNEKQNATEITTQAAAKAELPECVKEELNFLNKLSVEAFELSKNDIAEPCSNYLAYLKTKRYNERLSEQPSLSGNEAKTYKNNTLPSAVAILSKSCDDIEKAFNNAISSSNKKIAAQKKEIADLEPEFKVLANKMKILNEAGTAESIKTLDAIESPILKEEFRYNIFAYFKHAVDTQKIVEALVKVYPAKRARRIAEGCISP